MQDLRHDLQGPILVLGAGGFIGANLLRYVHEVRADVYGTVSKLPSWRLADFPDDALLPFNILVDYEIPALLDRVRPKTILDCIAYGAYSFETNEDLILRTNVNAKLRTLEEACERDVWRYVHAGSSSEYGTNASGTTEDSVLHPNSHYAVSKASAANLISYFGQSRGLNCANLRIYSAYGPLEDSARLIPALVSCASRGELPPFVDPRISRDFVYVRDVCEAFVAAAVNFKAEHRGASFNIGSGKKTTIGEIATTARELFGIDAEPRFSMEARQWDLQDWYANAELANAEIGWRAHTQLREGLQETFTWYEQLEDKEGYQLASKQYGLDTDRSISVIVACYKDAQAIPIMHERVTKVMRKLGVDYELIFVNDGSPDDSEQVINRLSATDRRVLGITHSRNFGSQAAFRSGMEIASKNSCVLMDGDLQDPPELIESFVEKWREGYEVVYGRRVDREAPFYMRILYKAFYRIFNALSYVPIPHDAGDFSLLDRRVVQSLLTFPERDLFIRGVRAFAGYRQCGVDYVRPERMFGRTTNSFLKNFDWAKKGIFAYSRTPLNLLTVVGALLFALAMVISGTQIVLKLGWPDLAPRGITTLFLLVIFFGSVNLLGLCIVGEYVGKILEETKRRPHFIRRSLIRGGQVQSFRQDGTGKS